MQTSRITTILLSSCIVIIAIGVARWSTLPPAPIQSAQRPKYYIPNAESGHLEHVKDAFSRAGYELITNENYTADWKVMWTFHNPFWNREPSVDLPAMMQKLKSHQKVNHVPGASRFASKIELVKNSRDLPFLPKSFLIPNEYEEFLEYHKKMNESIVWVRKGIAHRGIRIVKPYDEKLKTSEKEAVVQQFIKPYLLDKYTLFLESLCLVDYVGLRKLWDIGIYIAITSVNPLKVYYFDNILVRACTEDFEEDLNQAKKDSYVVADDYLPPWGLPSLRSFYTWGMSTLNVVRAYFHHQGVDFDEILKIMKKYILELIKSHREGLERASTKYPHDGKSFFSMYRVDFLLDRELKPWITEINQSPNLSSKHFADLQTVFQRIAYSLISLAGLAPGGFHHPYTNDEDLEILLHANDIDIAYGVCKDCLEDCSSSEKCALCRRCRTPTQSTLLKELISEQRSRVGFIPLYPIRNHTIQYLGDELIPGENNHLLQYYVWMKCAQDYTWC